MAIERLPEHLKTGRTARALTAPSAILLAGAGASAAILGGLPLLAAAGIGAVAWAARVAMALPRKPQEKAMDPFSLSEPWRTYMMEALRAKARYGQAVSTSEEGPLRERLAEIGARIDDGVEACWNIARRGMVLERAYGGLDVETTRRHLLELERSIAAQGGQPAGNAEATAASLRNQLASAERIAGTARDARDRLQLLGERLDEAAARAVELSVRAHDLGALGSLDHDVDAIVDEMEALRQAVEETSSPA